MDTFSLPTGLRVANGGTYARIEELGETAEGLRDSTMGDGGDEDIPGEVDLTWSSDNVKHCIWALCTEQNVPEAGLLGTESSHSQPDTMDSHKTALVVYLRQAVREVKCLLRFLFHTISIAGDGIAYESEAVSTGLLELWNWHTHLGLGLRTLSMGFNANTEFGVPDATVLQYAAMLTSQEQTSPDPRLEELLRGYEATLDADVDVLNHAFGNV